jgi:hypothetical protein
MVFPEQLLSQLRLTCPTYFTNDGRKVRLGKQRPTHTSSEYSIQWLGGSASRLWLYPYSLNGEPRSYQEFPKHMIVSKWEFEFHGF